MRAEEYRERGFSERHPHGMLVVCIFYFRGRLRQHDWHPANVAISKRGHALFRSCQRNLDRTIIAAHIHEHRWNYRYPRTVTVILLKFYSFILSVQRYQARQYTTQVKQSRYQELNLFCIPDIEMESVGLHHG